MKESCDSCRWWKDFSDRVYARVSGVKSNMAGDILELRRCRYSPPPQIEQRKVIYTDKDHVCSEYEKGT
jgi:hypothetical protein